MTDNSRDLTPSALNMKVWQEWTPRLEDYWKTWSHQYRHRVVEHVSKHTPLKGTVLEIGCSVGINLYLLQLQRPDITLMGFDANRQALNYAVLLVPELITGPAPVRHSDFPEVDTIFSTFTLSYIDPEVITSYLRFLSQKARTLVLAEPTYTGEGYRGEVFPGLPCEGYRYPYETLLKDLGMDVAQEPIDPDSKLNMITVATHGD